MPIESDQSVPEVLDGFVDGESRSTRGDLHDVAVRVAQVDGLEVGAVEDLGTGYAARAEVMAPGLELLLRVHGQREVMGRAAAHEPSSICGYSITLSTVPGVPSASPK